MRYFTIENFKNEYPEFANSNIQNRQISNACEMIFSQIGLIYRADWDETNVPAPIKEASMEQLIFILIHDLPFIDIDKKLKAGNMDVELKTDYSTLALRILGNHGYLYRGNPLNTNIGLSIPFRRLGGKVMFIINGYQAKLKQYNRINNDSIYDDQNYNDVDIRVCPYNVNHSVQFATYTVPEATGYFIVPRETDIREGDEIEFYEGQNNFNNIEKRTFSVLKVTPNWIFNRIENYIVAVK